MLVGCNLPRLRFASPAPPASAASHAYTTTTTPTPSPSSYKSSATRFWPELRKTMLVLFRSVVYLKSNLFVFLLATQTAWKSAFLLWQSINAFITYYFYLLFQSILWLLLLLALPIKCHICLFFQKPKSFLNCQIKLPIDSFVL